MSTGIKILNKTLCKGFSVLFCFLEVIRKNYFIKYLIKERTIMAKIMLYSREILSINNVKSSSTLFPIKIPISTMDLSLKLLILSFLPRN